MAVRRIEYGFSTRQLVEKPFEYYDLSIVLTFIAHISDTSKPGMTRLR